MGSSSRQNVVWLTIDSVRADRTTMGGHHRDTTPNLQRIANDAGGAWWDTCIAQTRWTPATTASILTGTYLSTHGVGVESPDVRPLPDSLATIPELLAEVGYESMGVGTNQYVCAATGMDRGFDRFHFPTARNLHRTVGLRAVLDYVRNVSDYGPGLTTDRTLHNVSSMVTRAAERWLSGTSPDAPRFLYVHYNNPHYAYVPPRRFLAPYAAEIGQPVEEVLATSRRVFDDAFDQVAAGLPLSDEEMAAIEAAYDAELAYTDHLIGQLFDHVQDTVPGETVFVVTGDHGETFGEHGWLGHHVLLTDELLHVPLVTHGLPDVGDAPTRPVQHVDLTRTLLDLAGARTDQCEGVNLTRQERHFAFAQRASRERDRAKLLDRNPAFDVGRYRWEPLNAVHDGRFKLVDGPSGSELFVLPDETIDRTEDYPEVAAVMADQLADTLPTYATSAGTDRERVEFDDEMRQRLEAMGYV